MDVPHLRPESFPDDQSDVAQFISDQLRGLDSLLTRFEAALALIDYAEQSRANAESALPPVEIAHTDPGAFVESRRRYMEQARVLREWILMAARDASMAVWDFFRTMTAVQANLARCPPLQADMPRDAIAKAIRDFSGRFPFRKEMRDAAAHQSDLIKSPGDRDTHAHIGPFDQDGILLRGELTKLRISNSMMGRKYTYTYNGSIIHIELTGETLEAMRQFQRRFYDAFRDADRTRRSRHTADR